MATTILWLIIQVRSNGAPRFARSAVYQLKGYMSHPRAFGGPISGRKLIPVLVCPYLSPEPRSICKEHDVAYLDLVGNVHLVLGTVFIDQVVPDRPKSEARALRSIFRPKAAAILRAMLRFPDRAMRVSELAQAANVSLGHVSNVRRALLEREWIEEREDGVVLADPGALLRTLRKNYRSPESHRVTGYTHLRGKHLHECIQGKLNPYPDRPRVIYSRNSAAQWFAPFARDAATTFYADQAGVDLLHDLLELRPAPRGANVVLRIPADDAVFEDSLSPAPGIFCTSPLVTYLELWNGGDRDREAAEHVARESFAWL